MNGPTTPHRSALNSRDRKVVERIAKTQPGLKGRHSFVPHLRRSRRFSNLANHALTDVAIDCRPIRASSVEIKLAASFRLSYATVMIKVPVLVDVSIFNYDFALGHRRVSPSPRLRVPASRFCSSINFFRSRSIHTSNSV